MNRDAILSHPAAAASVIKNSAGVALLEKAADLIVPLDVTHFAAACVDFYVVLAAIGGAHIHIEMIVAGFVVKFHAGDASAFDGLPGNLRGAFVCDELLAVPGLVGVIIIGESRGRGEGESGGDNAACEENGVHIRLLND